MIIFKHTVLLYLIEKFTKSKNTCYIFGNKKKAKNSPLNYLKTVLSTYFMSFFTVFTI